MKKKFVILGMVFVWVLGIIFMPLDLELNQSILVMSFLIVNFAWIVDIPSKTISSIFLLIIFLFFGGTPFFTVMFFPLSWDFLLIVFSFVFSQGIINSKLAEKLFQPLLSKFSRNVYEFLIFTILIITILVFTIPQPFSRVILLGIIYKSYFKKINLERKTQDVLMIGIFAANVIINIFFKRGDIVLNSGILKVANVEMSEFEWIKTLMLPAVGMLALAIISFLVIFRRELSFLKGGSEKLEEIKMDKDDKINLLIIIMVVLFWATENIHDINGVTIVFVGLILMCFRKILDIKDFKSINFEMLIFLTAAFSIGKVMEGSGIANKLFFEISPYLPKEFSLKFVWIIVVSTMALHMVLGSCVTTMSLAIPSFISVIGFNVDSAIIMFLVYISIVSQYLLPIHNSIIIVGASNNYYTNREVFILGVAMTMVTLISIILFFIPWWNYIGFF